MECRKRRKATAPIQSLVKLQTWFLSLRWKSCLRQKCSLGSYICSKGPAPGQNSMMMMMMIIIIIIIIIIVIIIILCFRERQHLRSLAPVMNEYGWWWPNDIRGPWGPKASRHLSYRWGKTSKKPHPGNLSWPGIEPGPAVWQAHMLPPGPQRWTKELKL